MYDEVNTGTNLPAQIDLYAVQGSEYNFLCIAKGGGSANKTYLYQETKALLTPGKLEDFLIEKMKSLGTAACPPYHLAFVIGGTSAEANLKTVKLASAKYYDNLPTEGNELGQAFRDIALEERLKKASEELAWCAVWWEIFCTRRTGDPSTSTWCFLPGGDGRILLGRPQHQSEDQPRRDMDRKNGRQPGTAYSGGISSGR